MARHLGHFNFKALAGSCRSAGCPEGGGFNIKKKNNKHTLFFLLFSHLLKTTEPAKSQITYSSCFHVARHSSVFWRIIHLHYLLACSLSGMFLGALWLGFWGQWIFCPAFSKLVVFQSFLTKSQQQGFNFELVLEATVSPARLVMILIF